MKAAFDDARTNQNYLPSKFRNANAVYVLISTGDCVPDWGLELLQQCETCWKAGRYELSALEELRFLRRDLY